jgi:large subunit ribosomal protein L31
MRKNIHPIYKDVKVTCSCGNSFIIRSTLVKNELNIDVCNKCHPFFSGKQKIIDTAGRVESFMKKFK